MQAFLTYSFKDKVIFRTLCSTRCSVAESVPGPCLIIHSPRLYFPCSVHFYYMSPASLKRPKNLYSARWGLSLAVQLSKQFSRVPRHRPRLPVSIPPAKSSLQSGLLTSAPQPALLAAQICLCISHAGLSSRVCRINLALVVVCSNLIYEKEMFGDIYGSSVLLLHSKSGHR